MRRSLIALGVGRGPFQTASCVLAGWGRLIVGSRGEGRETVPPQCPSLPTHRLSSSRVMPTRHSPLGTMLCTDAGLSRPGPSLPRVAGWR
jgi:hypothetical protein